MAGADQGGTVALGLPLLPSSWVPHSPRAREQGGCRVKSRGLKPTSVSQYAPELPQPYRLEVRLGTRSLCHHDQAPSLPPFCVS